jgi:tetratricopeptide (TPR) repeat protein
MLCTSRFLRPGVLLLAGSLGLLLVVPPAQGRFGRPDLVNVPIARVVANLEALAEKNPKDARVRLNLARAHAMAYALATDTAQVRRGKETEGVWLGYTPRHVPFNVKKVKDPKKQEEAKKHLDAAIAWYEQAIKADKNNVTAQLGHAWALEQAGQKEQAIAGYRKVVKAAWAKEKDMRRAPLGWHSATAEAAGYLIPLLDPKKDKEEIASLQKKAKKARSIPRPITPLVVPLRACAGPEALSDREARVTFDADGSGRLLTWTWVTPEAGWLVYDHQGTREVTSALQLFGNVTFWMFWENGYRALSVLDDNGDGYLTGKELNGLAIWQDRNRNGKSEPGEVKPVRAHGIVSLRCREESISPPEGCAAFARQGVKFADGNWRPTYDIVLQQR